MGREVRRVPANWEHPEGKALYDQDVESAWKDWFGEWNKWLNGEFGRVRRANPEFDDPADQPYLAFCKWHGSSPDPDYYRPKWRDEERTHYQMYETTSEGTPISPVMASPEELARWLADNNASAFGKQTASYEEWLWVCKGGYAPSAVYSSQTGLVSGVEVLAGESTKA